MDIETIVLDIIEEKRSSFFLRGILHGMSHCYQLGVFLRNVAYDQIIPSTKVSIPVISVGNIVAGGTGKTPFVHFLAEKFISSAKISILSRGYKRKGKKTCVVNETTSFEECGDEPFLLFKKLPNAKIIVGKSRVFSAQLAKILGSQMIFLDDGMQYRQLDRDFEIGVMHADDLFGKGFYLPRGFLRDSPKRLAKTDLIVVNGVKCESQFEKIESLLKSYSASPVIAMGLTVENTTITNQKVGAFCAIAQPYRFYDTLHKLGCEIALKNEKQDHGVFHEEELIRFANRSLEEGAKSLVCTEKDAVKIPSTLKLSLPIVPIKIALKPLFGEKHLEKFIKKIKGKVHEQRI